MSDAVRPDGLRVLRSTQDVSVNMIDVDGYVAALRSRWPGEAKAIARVGHDVQGVVRDVC